MFWWAMPTLQSIMNWGNKLGILSFITHLGITYINFNPMQ